MQKLKIFITLTGYQFTWLACVLGEKYFLNLGIYIGLIYLALYFYFSKNKIKSPKNVLSDYKGSFKEGNPDGIFKYYYPDGKIKSSLEYLPLAIYLFLSFHCIFTLLLQNFF